MRIQELVTDDQRLALPVIADKDLTSEANADTSKVYIVGASATGLWATQDGKIAYYDQQWRFITPQNGYQVLIDDENQIYTYQDGAWASDSSLVSITAAAVTLTKKDHGNGKAVVLNRAAGVTATLPAATGSGDKFEIFVGTTVTSNNDIIKVANANDTIVGFAHQFADGGATMNGYEAAGTDDTITLDGSTKGGIKGDKIVLRDIAANLWHVDAVLSATGTEASPFSATVS